MPVKKAILIFPDIREKKSKWKIPFEFPYTGHRPPLGILYVASILKRMDVHPIIIDRRIMRFPLRKILSLIQEENPLFLGIYSDYFLKDLVKSYISFFKNTNVPILIGGPGHFHYEEFLNSGADLVVHGEAEETLSLIVEGIIEGSPPEGIKNISYIKDGIIKRYEGYVLLSDLDKIPYPYREDIPFYKYNDPFIPLLKPPATTIIASRGCPFNCAFCAVPSLSQRFYRVRSVENVIDEIKYLKRKFGINYLIFEDDCFGIKEKWTKELCEHLNSSGLKINWMCIIHPSTFKENKKEMASTMIKAGCNTVVIGLQSPLKDVLLSLNRNQKEIENTEELIYLFKKDAMVIVEFIVGLAPGDEEEREIMNFLRRTSPHLAKFHPLTFLPYTPLWNKKWEGVYISEKEREERAKNLYINFYLKNPLHQLKNIKFIWNKNKGWFLRAILSQL